ncbi:MAG: hypothetical protein L0220_27765, partial [Acidobacteria bacterium]|nr:hypothetical protein [Acidobacteriota bacterium]
SLETEILKLMEKIEKLEANITERTPEMESQRIEVDRQITEWSAAVTANQQRLDELIAQRARNL